MNEALIQKFYSSFQQKDWRSMQDCYDDKVVFSDPVFQKLKGGEARAMWHMLTAAGKDLVVTFQNVRVEGFIGSCDWDARYTFSKTGNRVHNIIHAEFEFSGGKIIRHADTFDLKRWAGMALGTTGKLLGWVPFFQAKIRGTAERSLKKFMLEHPEYNS